MQMMVMLEGTSPCDQGLVAHASAILITRAKMMYALHVMVKWLTLPGPLVESDTLSAGLCQPSFVGKTQGQEGCLDYQAIEMERSGGDHV